jgi:pimeloyl-ACP methyl ester carboxylesterase
MRKGMTILRRYANCRDGQIHLRESGPADGPVVAFFHQTASSGAMFEQVMEQLGDRYRCLSFDSPGFGGSYQPENIPDIRFLGDRLLEALDDLGVDRAHLCGHHTGGCVALEMAVAAPERARSLTIIAPVVASEPEKAEYAKTFVRPFAVEETGAFLQTAWDYLRMIGAGANVELHRREMVDHLIAHRTMPMAFSAVWRQDVATLLTSVQAPLHLMCSKDDVLWPLFERSCAMRPDAATSIVGGADFQPDLDPDGVAAALRTFLDEQG